MKTILACLLLAALSVSAADITVVIRNDSGVTVASVVLTTSNAVLTSVNNWRLQQLVGCTPAEKPGDPCVPVLKFPTTNDFLRWLIREAFLDILRSHPPANVAAKEAAAATATQEAKTLREAAIQ